MRRNTRFITGILCVLTSAFMLAGCGSSSSVSTEKKDIVKSEETASETTETASEETVKESGAEALTEETTESSEAVTIEEQVLVDQDGIKITATEYEADSIWGDGIKLLIENDTDKDVTVGCNALIVNDFMISDLFASNVAAGKKANETMHLMSSQLKAAGIESVGQVEVYFHIYDSNSFDNLFDTGCVTIKTSAYENMDTSADDSGTELYNEGGIRIIGKTVDENSFWGTAILLYCENTSGKNVGISVDDMSVNGFMMTPYFSTTVYDGKKSFNDITLLSSELESNGIEAIEEVELKFHIYDVDTYSTITDSDPITFSAK